VHIFKTAIALALATVLVASCGGASSHQPERARANANVHSTGPQSFNQMSQGTQAVTVSNFNRPKLRAVGNGSKCSLSTGSTFRFVGSGFTPGGKVVLLVFAPSTYKDPLYANTYSFYWFQKNFGVQLANSRGVVQTKLWDCRYGPANTRDVQGVYEAKGFDWRSGIASGRALFKVVQ
jgi:hypothetical protein